MATLGEKLKSAREQRGATPSQAAAATRIKMQHIEAMEADQFQRISAPTYAKGFLRMYAEYLGLDPAPLVREFVGAGSASWNAKRDTYWSGKAYGKVAEVAAIARSLGMTAEADTLISWLKSELQDWFSASTAGVLDKTKRRRKKKR